MRFLLWVIVCGVALTGCATPKPANAVGSDRDEHGCIPSAGYHWCPRTEQCERPWELARTEGFENDAGAFDAWCRVTN
ncbi:MAG: serine protease [Myxococcota bacterium]